MTSLERSECCCNVTQFDFSGKNQCCKKCRHKKEEQILRLEFSFGNEFTEIKMNIEFSKKNFPTQDIAKYI